MSVPIIGEKHNQYIIVEMAPGLTPGAFDINLNTEHFTGGVPLAVQCLLQAAASLLPHAFQAVADSAAQQLLLQQRAQHNGGH